MKPASILRRVFLPFLAFFFALSLARSAQAEVLKIVVDDTIQPITAEYIDRAIAEAERNKDQALLIELSTPGGLMSSMEDIIQKILASQVPVIIYVAPSGSSSASAGFFILESADIAAMAPGTNTGAAHPVSMFGEIKGAMKEKVENNAAAFIRSYVSKRGRNVEMAESAVRQSKSWTDQEALSQKLIDYVAPNEEDLFKQMQGKPIKRFNGQTVTLNLVGEPVRLFNMTLRQQVLDFFMNPNIAFLFLILGALGIYIEFTHPGMVAPGMIGGILILLVIFSLNMLPVRFAALALIFVAFALFALEAKFATHGVLTAGGIVTMILGALSLVDAPIPEMRVHLVTALAVSIPFGLITVFLVSLVLKARANKTVTGAQGLVGEVGMTQSALSPQGKVFVHGEIWDAVSLTNIPAGQRVVVKKVDGLQLEVEAAPTTDRTPSSVL